MSDNADANQPIWRTSSRSGGTNCVEVSTNGPMVLARDSKDSDGPVLRFTRDEWNHFLAEIKSDAHTP